MNITHYLFFAKKETPQKHLLMLKEEQLNTVNCLQMILY